MTQQPRAGLILLSAEWFDSIVAMPDLAGAVQQDAESIRAWLAPHLDLRGCWRVQSAQTLEACCREIRASAFDLLILVFQVWAEDHYLHRLKEAIQDTPLLVWCYQPWSSPPRPASFLQVLRGSGMVGTLEGMGTLRNLGLNYQFVYGAVGETALLDAIRQTARAGMVKSRLRRAQFGVLPYRNDQMHSTFVDEFRLRSELGPALTYLSVDELRRAADALPASDVEQCAADQRRQFPLDGVSADTLHVAARASLGLAALAQARGLDLISLNDIAPELHDTLGLRPCLYPRTLDQAGILVTLEGDLGAATAAFILNHLTGAPLLFCEPWFWDERDNLIAAGHAGLQNPAVAAEGTARLTRDYEFHAADRYPGAHYQYIARPGRVTLLHLRATPTDWQAVALAGEAVAMPPWVEGYPHAAIRLDPPVGEFLRVLARVGSTQHFIMAYGDCLAEIASLFSLLGLPLEVIR